MVVFEVWHDINAVKNTAFAFFDDTLDRQMKYMICKR